MKIFGSDNCKFWLFTAITETGKTSHLILRYQIVHELKNNFSIIQTFKI